MEIAFKTQAELKAYLTEKYDQLTLEDFFNQQVFLGGDEKEINTKKAFNFILNTLSVIDGSHHNKRISLSGGDNIDPSICHPVLDKNNFIDSIVVQTSLPDKK